MFHPTETKPQTWRALAVLDDGSECLLFVGRSTTHVRGAYAAAFAEVLDAGERALVSRISLQRWDGVPDRGRWVASAALAVPSSAARTRCA
jgi:hypothetical protein